MESFKMLGLKPFRYLPKPVQILIQINAGVFGLVLFASLFRIPLNNLIVGYGALVPLYFEQAWRFLTYNFIHIQFFHFLFNMLMLWMFGDEVATQMGNKRFLQLYLFSGVFAGVFSVPFYLSGALSPYASIIGASGALMGIFVAYYKFFPERTIFLFMVIPIKIKHAIWLLVAIDILFSRSGDSVAHFTHLGGVLAGFIYMYLYEKDFRLGLKFRPRSPKSSSPKVLEGEVAYMDADKQMDAILSKVSREGLNVLTEAEKEYLLKAGKRARRRRGL